MRLSTALGIAFGMLVFGAGISRAQNLLVNGDFDTDLAGWYRPASWVEDSWSAIDIDASPSSGSVRQENVNVDGVKTSGIGQCIPVTEGESYRVSGATFVPSGQDAVGAASIVFQWKDGTDCTGEAIGGGLGTGGSGLFDEWYVFVSDFVVAPAGAGSMQLDLLCRKTTAAGTFVAYWDDLVVVPELATGLLQGAALLALGACRARRAARARDCAAMQRLRTQRLRS
jgi:hypothetical protein